LIIISETIGRIHEHDGVDAREASRKFAAVECAKD
jgi:hypothetical protein